jgi:uncharacterized protein
MVTIVFTREPIAGETKTRLIRRLGAANAAALADAFARDAIAKARVVGAPIVIAGSAPAGVGASPYFRGLARHFGAQLANQSGGTLGVRMAGVLEPYRATGAVLFGTDTPSLPLRMLRQNIALLRRFPVVLGPSLDGGYYLIGVRGKMPDIFRGVRWGGPHVLQQTIKRLEAMGIPYALGPAWYDVDRWSDVMLLAAHLRRMAKAPGGRPRASGLSWSTPSDANPCPTTARLLTRLGLI